MLLARVNTQFSKHQNDNHSGFQAQFVYGFKMVTLAILFLDIK
jgi:hypothetical protein